jgi:hypothetical protein
VRTAAQLILKPGSETASGIAHQMNANHLGIYINDHLAGSVTALELLGHLVSKDAGTSRGQFFIELRRDIEKDQSTLRDLLERLDFKENPMRKAVGWFSEKFARTKLSVEDPGGDHLGIFEKLEGLSLGIAGKQGLWRALNAVADATPELQAMDLTALEQRASEQFERVETLRLDAAREAFA